MERTKKRGKRPTASERKQRQVARQAEIVEYQAEAENVDHQAEAENVETEIPPPPIVVSAPQVQGPFPGGPEDTSLLISFANHIALRLWTGVEEDRGSIRVINHGPKIEDIGQPADAIKAKVILSGLAPLIECTYKLLDKGVLSAFVERWHRDTYSFHFPVGEMTVTLDDVSNLLHLPISGNFFTPPLVDRDSAVGLLHDLLGMTYEDSLNEIKDCRGAHVRLSTLREIYEDKLEKGQLERATRAYLMYLVGGTIFTDKSNRYIDVAYLEAFRDLDSCGNYAWGVAALVHLYDHLCLASFHETRQLASYLSLLQAWIYEHFTHPRLCSRHEKDYDEEDPRATRWTPIRGTGLVDTPRRILDELTNDDVCWMPYTEHRQYHDFNLLSLFRGWIRWGSLTHLHLPDRVLRQYGYVQSIPGSPHEFRGRGTSAEDIDQTWLHCMDRLIDLGTEASDPAATVDGYFEWFHRVSHPYIIPRATPPTASTSSTFDSGTSHVKYNQAVEILQDMIEKHLVLPEGMDMAQRALNLIRTANGEELVYQRKKRTRGR